MSDTETRPMRDEKLVILYRESGDEKHYNELYHRHHKRLAALLRAFLRSHPDIDQQGILNNVFADFHQYCLSDNRLENIQAWLSSAVKNRALERIRWHGRQKRGGGREHVSLTKVINRGEDGARLCDTIVDEEQKTPDDAMIHDELKCCFQAAIAGLSAPNQEVLNAVYYRGLSHSEAASTLHLPIGTVKSRLHHALRTLRVHLEDKILN